MSDTNDSKVARAMQRIEELVAALEGAEAGPVKDSARELVGVLLDLHREGLETLWSAVQREPGGLELTRKLGENEAIGALLLVHGLAVAEPTPELVPVERLVRKEKAPAEHEAERCELCAAPIGSEHDHLWNLERRELSCACRACATLFQNGAGHFMRVEHRVEPLGNFRVSDSSWDALGIPIGLAFFQRRAKSEEVVAFYPSPAGATQAEVPRAAWLRIARENPVLEELAPEVEALLVNRMGEAREAYRLSIDECYRLVGLLRKQWRGLGGGSELWSDVGRFFGELRSREERAHG